MYTAKLVKIYHRDNCFEHPSARAKKERSVIYLNGQMGRNVFLQSDLIWSLTGCKKKYSEKSVLHWHRCGVQRRTFSSHPAPGAGQGLRSASLGTETVQSRNYKDQEQHLDSPQGVARKPVPSVNVRGAELNVASMAEKTGRSLLSWQKSCEVLRRGLHPRCSF